MALFLNILLFIFIAACGFIVQFFSRWSPWINLLVTYVIVLILPPFWSPALVGGIWVACAFFTFHPENEKKVDVSSSLNWRRLILSSLWTFSGFLLTLLFLWKTKVLTDLSVPEREMSAWFFMILIEICFYKVLTQLSLRLHKIPLGYGIALINFLMLFYWVFHLGLFTILLIFITLLIINPLLLIWLDPSMRTRTPFVGRIK